MRSYAEISDKTSTYEYFGDTIQPKTTFFTSQCLSFTCETGLLTIPTLWGWYKDSVVRAGKAFEVSCPQHTASDWQVSAITLFSRTTRADAAPGKRSVLDFQPHTLPSRHHPELLPLTDDVSKQGMLSTKVWSG